MKAKHGVAVIALFLVAMGSMGQLSSNAPFFREARIGKAEIDTDGDISTPGAISAASFSAPSAGGTNVNAGVDDTTQGTVSVFGDGTTGGGILGIYNGAGADGTVEYWRWIAHTDGTLKMQRALPGPSTSDWLTVSTAGVPTFSEVITSSVSTGTAPFSVASTTVVPNLNVSQLLGGTWAIPGSIGATTRNQGAFTNVGIGNSSPTSMLDIESTNGVGNNAYMRIRESRGSGNNARLNLGITNNDNDAYIEMQRSGIGSWTHGLDGSDSNSWVLSWSATLGTNNRIRVTTAGAVSVPGDFASSGNATFGDASTDTYTFTGRLIPRDANDADMVNVPGTTGEVVRNTADTPDSLWYCTAGNVSNATWAEIDTTGAGGGGNAYWGAATSGSPGTTLSVADDSVVVFDGLGSINNTVTTLSNGVAGQTVTFFNDDNTYDITFSTGGNILTGVALVGNNTPSKWATYIYDGTNWRKLANN